MRGETRGQSGLDRLLLFVVFLVAVAAITPFVLELGGIDVRGGADDSRTPEGTAPPADNGVVVLGATGTTGGFGEDTVGVVRIVVTKNGTGSAIDTSAMTATWVSSDDSYSLTAVGSETGSGADAAFGVNVTGSSNAGTLDKHGDRATLTFDLGTDDVGGIPEFGHRLVSGETVSLVLTTDSGATTHVTLTVPGSLGGKQTVRL